MYFYKKVNTLYSTITLLFLKYRPKESNFRIMGNEPTLRPPGRLKYYNLQGWHLLWLFFQKNSNNKKIRLVFSLITTFPQLIYLSVTMIFHFTE